MISNRQFPLFAIWSAVAFGGLGGWAGYEYGLSKPPAGMHIVHEEGCYWLYQTKDAGSITREDQINRHRIPLLHRSDKTQVCDPKP
jgi:hypothetical protein